MTIFCLAVYIRPRDLKMSTGLHKACLILCILGVFSSLASGPWLGLALSLFCLGYDRISKGVRGRWKLLVLGLALVVLLLSIASNRGPIKLVIHYLTLSPETGHIRIAMWECIWALIPDYWLLGWGWTGEWPRAVEWYVWDSVDSFYGVLFIHAGIFAVLSIVAFLASSWYRLSKSSFGQDLSKTEGKGWILGTVCLFLTAITVHIFGNLIFATYFLLGAGQALISTPKPMVFSDSLACRDTHPKELMVDSAF